MDRAALVAGLLGTPYGRDERHCWWLATLVQRDLFGRALPLAPAVFPDRHDRSRLFATHPDRASWQLVAQPADGDLVLMARTPGRDIHCGVFLVDHGRVIHTDDPHGVVLDTALELTQSRRWRLSFHRPLA